MTKPAPSRIGYLDGLRALAALYVVWHHTTLICWPPWVARPDDPVALGFCGLFLFGRFAVATFMVLSGFCLGMGVARKPEAPFSGPTFLRRRVRRIVPPYLAAMVFCLLLIVVVLGERTGTIWDLSVPVTWKAILAHGLLLQDIFAREVGGRINSVFWSVAVEMHAYLLLPLLMLAQRRVGLVVLSLLGAVVSTAVAMQLLGSRFDSLWVGFYSLFCLGVAAAQFGFGMQGREEWWRLGAVVATAALIAFFWFVPVSRWMQIAPLVYAGYGVVIGAWLVWMARAPESWLARLLSVAPLRWVGRSSYSLYLIHLPLLQLVWLGATRLLHLDSGTTFVVLATIGVSVCVAAANGFYLLFERPWLSRGELEPQAGSRMAADER